SRADGCSVAVVRGGGVGGPLCCGRGGGVGGREGAGAACGGGGVSGVVDGRLWLGIVVHDRARAGVLRDGRVGGTAQLDREGLAQLEGRVRARSEERRVGREGWRGGERAGLAEEVGSAPGGRAATGVAGGGSVSGWKG